MSIGKKALAGDGWSPMADYAEPQKKKVMSGGYGSLGCDGGGIEIRVPNHHSITCQHTTGLQHNTQHTKGLQHNVQHTMEPQHNMQHTMGLHYTR